VAWSGANRGTLVVAERKAKGGLGSPVSHPEHDDTPNHRSPGRVEPAAVPDADDPVRTCHRYLSNRLAQLDYQGALEQGLPCPSAPRRDRKRPPLYRAITPQAPHNAAAMLALRVARANGQGSAYWQDLRQAAR
jgi:hypothetical protein